MRISVTLPDGGRRRSGHSLALAGWGSLVVLLLLAAPGAAAELSFTAPPAAVRQDGKVRITFALAQPADVDVAVVGADGRVVRHLAAGVLGGPQPPPPPLQAGLAQTLDWDGRDDFGQPPAPAPAPGAATAAGPFQVRVRAGTGVKFGRFLGDSPYAFGRIVSLATDEAGVVYLMGFGGNRNQNFHTIRAFDAQGRYLRELMPFPADLAPPAMKDVAAWDASAAAFRPRNLNSLNPEFYTEGKLSLASASARDGLVLTDGEKVYRLDPRGGVPGPAFATQDFWPKNGRNPNTGGGPVCLAASPDGQYLYLSGPFSSKTRYGHQFNPAFPPGRVYRLKVSAGETMQPFVTLPVAHQEGQDGAYRKHNAYYNDGVPEGPVHGVAVDAQGRVYACDREQERIAIFDADGREVGALAVPNPHQVAVDARTGAVYVLSRYCAGYWQYDCTVSKFSEAKPGAVATAKYAFARSKGGWPQMALAAAGDAMAVYVAGVPGDLVCLREEGGKLTPTPTAFAAPAEALDVFNRIAVDAQREEVYVSDGGNRFWRFDGRTGAGELLAKAGKPFLGTDLAVGYDGLLYVRTGEGFSGPLERYTRDLQPAPYPSGTHVLSQYIYGRYGIGNCEKGLGVGPDGKVYVAFMYDWVKYCVAGFGPDGKALRGRYLEGQVGRHGDLADKANLSRGYPPELTSAIVGPIPQCNGGVRVDLAGNLYVGMVVGPKPTWPGLEKDAAYQHCTGCVVKFGPEGGTVPGAADMMTGAGVTGALATYSGLSPFSHPHLGTTCCVCRIPRFDVDRYGRLALPNATGNFVLLLDNAGNPILTFGQYGNFDSQYVNPIAAAGQAGQPTVPTPAIPLGWPNGAGISDGHIYVLDVYARRVVRADLTWKLQATCAAP